MKLQKSVVVAASVLILSACGAPPPKPNPAPQVVAPPKLDLNDSEAVAGASSAQRDEYNKTTHYIGPNIAEKHPDQLFIRAWKSDIGRVTYQIYVTINYSGAWRFYNTAKDARSNTLDLAVLTRNLGPCQRNDCSHSEHLEIDVTQKYLEENMQSGLRVTVSGKAGEERVFFISPGYIKAFLSLLG